MFKDMTVEEMLAKFDVKLGEAFWAHLEYESIGVSQDYKELTGQEWAA